ACARRPAPGGELDVVFQVLNGLPPGPGASKTKDVRRSHAAQDPQKGAILALPVALKLELGWRIFTPLRYAVAICENMRQKGNLLSIDTVEKVKRILRDALQLGAQAERLTASSALLGSIPELDSMAVVTVVTLIEEEFGISVQDDEISAETFATVG